MALIDTVLTFRDRENEPDPFKASWYLVSVCQVPDWFGDELTIPKAAALAGAGAGSETLPVYRAAIADLPSDAANAPQQRGDRCDSLALARSKILRIVACACHDNPFSTSNHALQKSTPETTSNL